MSKGVIVQFEQDTALLLKNDGSFASCPRSPSWQIGDVIGIPKQKFWFLSRKLIALSVALLFTLFGGIGFAVYQIPITVVELSVNPSVQITVNRFDRVLSAEGLNAAGENLVQGMSYRNHSLTEVYHRLMSRLANNNYLTDSVVQFVVANDSFARFLVIEDNLREVFEQHFFNETLRVSIIRFDMNEYRGLSHPIPIAAIPADLQAPARYDTQSTQHHNQRGNWQNGWWRWDCCN